MTLTDNLPRDVGCVGHFEKRIAAVASSKVCIAKVSAREIC